MLLNKLQNKRFWSRVNKTRGCWEWLGSRNGRRYGTIYINPRELCVHRVSYELLVGRIPKGLALDHLCKNTFCVNPKHLEPVTIKENILRGIGTAAINARKTHCKNGHEFTKENTLFQSGRRICRPCKRAYEKECYQKETK